MEEAHAGVAGDTTGVMLPAKKFLRAGLWWPTLHNDVAGYALSVMYVNARGYHRGEMRCR